MVFFFSTFRRFVCLTDSGKVLLILNPKSGPGKAKEIFQEQILPVLIEAEVDYDLHVTKAQNDARYCLFSNVCTIHV